VCWVSTTSDYPYFSDNYLYTLLRTRSLHDTHEKNAHRVGHDCQSVCAQGSTTEPLDGIWYRHRSLSNRVMWGLRSNSTEQHGVSIGNRGKEKFGQPKNVVNLNYIALELPLRTYAKQEYICNHTTKHTKILNTLFSSHFMRKFVFFIFLLPYFVFIILIPS
jgi:hypothetical protein